MQGAAFALALRGCCTDCVGCLLVCKPADFWWIVAKQGLLSELCCPVLQVPMDLSRVLEKLHSGFYPHPSAVLRETALIWRNCRAFNMPGSDVFNACNQLEALFDKQWRKARLERLTVSFADPAMHEGPWWTGQAPTAGCAVPSTFGAMSCSRVAWS